MTDPRPTPEAPERPGTPAQAAWTEPRLTGVHRRVVGGALLGGAALRLAVIPSARFTGDEAHFWDVARRVGAFEHLPVVGPPITGEAARLPGGLFHYVTAVPHLFGASPYLGSVFMVLLHILAGAFLIDFARRARGPRAAAVAALLWAVAPWDVLYGDKIWASCLAPVFGAVALWAAARARVQARWAAAATLACGVLPQIHLSAPVVWSATVVLLFGATSGRAVRRWSAAGAGAALLTYGPYLAVEAWRGFPNTRLVLARSGGSEPLEGLLWMPARVLVQGVLFATGEIGYQLERGYWGGGFDALSALFTPAGWAAWGARYGGIHGGVVGLGLGLALVGWLVHFGRGRASASVDARASELDRRMGLAVLVGLATGATLMMAAKKTFYPHYVNVLMPFALWPAISGLDRLLAAPRIRPWVGAAGIIALGGLLASTVRYYREVDVLNGLGPTLRLLEQVRGAPPPIDLRFRGFDNGYAWRTLAGGLPGPPLRVDRRSPLRFVVHNDRRGASAPVRLERVDPPRTHRWRAYDHPEAAEVVVTGAPGLGPCRPVTGGCRYGPQPWQRLTAEHLPFGGRLEPALFMHPVESATVTATFARPDGLRVGELRFGLTDPAHRSENRAPVQVELSAGRRTLVRRSTPTRPGWLRVPFTLPEGAERLRLDITTTDEGARVFGFDLRLGPR